MRLKNLDLLLSMAIAALNIMWALLPNRPPVVGIILALPLVFVLPGYILTEALFYKRSLNTSELLIFSLGLSLSIDILSGIILNLLPIGLQAISWAVFLGLLTVIFSLLVAYLRLRRIAPVEVTRPLRLRFSIYGSILFGLALIVAFLAILYAANGVVKQPHPGFTQFWMIPQVQADKSCTVRLGMRSFEPNSVTYRIKITINGTEVNSWSSVVLTPQSEWVRLVPITPGTTVQNKVEAQLYRLDKPQVVYRKVTSALDNCSTLKATSTIWTKELHVISGFSRTRNVYMKE